MRKGMEIWDTNVFGRDYVFKESIVRSHSNRAEGRGKHNGDFWLNQLGDHVRRDSRNSRFPTNQNWIWEKGEEWNPIFSLLFREMECLLDFAGYLARQTVREIMWNGESWTINHGKRKKRRGHSLKSSSFESIPLEGMRRGEKRGERKGKLIIDGVLHRFSHCFWGMWDGIGWTFHVLFRFFWRARDHRQRKLVP